ncbi:legumain-like [Asterias amurensis]|uniref:legumain-like n=1 Tax=Asterias amurensis TaxID=7602 RepID=UPI003AB196F3
MKMLLSLLVLLPLVAAFPVEDAFPMPEAEPSPTKHWGLLVAGSNGWGNYRHQADVCHAYQILHKNGIPDERIVVMMFDDIANNEANPTPGVIINRPNGSDVYHGVPKDYTGKNVNPKNFLNVLSGNKAAMNGIGSGKVIDSGPNDHVFVFFSDHGAKGLIAFMDDMLYAKDLITTLKSMSAAQKFQKLVFYLEACESGSMFENLPNSINIYATTASGPDKSSYACYFDKKRNTYLGDVYSVKWMEDSDKEDLTAETLQKQFKIVKRETNTSVVHQFGDLKFDRDTLNNFQGNGGPSVPGKPLPNVPLDAIDNRDVPLDLLFRRFEKETDPVQKKWLMEQVAELAQMQQGVHSLMYGVTRSLVGENSTMIDSLINTRGRPIKNWDCYKAVTQTYREQCYTISQSHYAWGQVHVLGNLCEMKFGAPRISNRLQVMCSEQRGR